jgi:biotin carboxylase
MPAYRQAKSAEEAVVAARELGLPVVIKPVDSQSSRGVTKVTDIAAVPAAAARALVASRSHRLLVEEMMVGPESSIESFVAGDAVHVLGICDKVKCAPPYSFDLQLIYPAAFPPDVLAAIRELNSNVIRAIGIRMGFVHAEVMITTQGVRLIEIAARGCGARVATNLLPELTGVDLLGLRLRQALGEPIAVPRMSDDRHGILRFFDIPAGMVARVEGLREAAAQPEVIHFEFGPRPGVRFERPVSGDGRPGFFMAVAGSRAEVVAIADKVTSLVEVEVL